MVRQKPESVPTWRLFAPSTITITDGPKGGIRHYRTSETNIALWREKEDLSSHQSKRVRCCSRSRVQKSHV